MQLCIKMKRNKQGGGFSSYCKSVNATGVANGIGSETGSNSKKTGVSCDGYDGGDAAIKERRQQQQQLGFIIGGEALSFGKALAGGHEFAYPLLRWLLSA